MGIGHKKPDPYEELPYNLTVGEIPIGYPYGGYEVVAVEDWKIKPAMRQ